MTFARTSRVHTLAVWLLALLLPLAAGSASFAQEVRQRTLIDRDWRFYLGDAPGAQAPAFADASWQPVGLPHSFGAPYFGATRFYIGYGWYRKHLTIPALRPDQRASLEFEAAFQDAEVFVNGKLVGEHLGGYTGFRFDITDAVRPGDNVVAVRLNNKWNAQLNPRAGEHNFNGGLYRNVYLVVTPDLHVDWYGTFVTTPGLSKAGGPVHVATDVRNDSARERHFTLVNDVLDGSGATVTTVRTPETIAANQTVTFQQQTPSVPSPALWSPQHPSMYRVRTRLLEGERPGDEFNTPFGFRWIQWTAEQGFFLNGEHYYFHGADVHQDHAGWGDGVTNAGIARDVRLVKQAGMDFIRGSHYPHSPVFADECDRQGILFWSENSFWGTAGPKEDGFWTASAYPPNPADQAAFEESVHRSLREMIRINRNHPSIIVWSMTNEVFFSNRDLMPKVRDLIRSLVADAHQQDPTRPAGAGGVQRGDLDKLSDVAGYNGDGATLFLDPGVPSAVTEYGSVESVRPGVYDPTLGDMTGQPEFAWRGGQALWCAFDHGSIFVGPGNMGMVDYFRLPKGQWYWYRNAFAHIPPPPAAKPGTPARLTLRTDAPGPFVADGTGDVQVIVEVRDAAGQRLSNSPPVKLEIVSGPGEFPTGRQIAFAPDSDIAIRDGEAAMEMRSYQSGSIHVRATSPGLEAADLTVEAQGGPAFVAGVTPLAPTRPYVLYGNRLQVRAAPGEIALNHPTATSSSLPGHTGGAANDGEPGTYWQPANSAAASWWQVDFESLNSVQSVQLTMEQPGPLLFQIQVQQPDGTWKTVVDACKFPQQGPVYIVPVPDPTYTRLLRVVFPGSPQPIRLHDVRIQGAPIQ